MGAVVGTSTEELVLWHLPPKVEPPPTFSTEFERVAFACEFDGAAEKLDKAFEEVKVKVEKAMAKVVEEEERVAGVERELGRVQKQIAAHKGDDQRRERRRREEAKAAREEQDAEMRGWTEGEMARRRIVRVKLGSASRKEKGGGRFGRRVSVWALPLWVTSTWTGLVEMLRNLPDLDRDKCLRGLGRGCTVSEASEIGGETNPNLIDTVYRLPRKVRTNSRVG